MLTIVAIFAQMSMLIRLYPDDSTNTIWHLLVAGGVSQTSRYNTAGKCFSQNVLRYGDQCCASVRSGLVPIIMKTETIATEIGGESPTNGAKSAIDTEIPYIAQVVIQGTADILFHRWNCEAVDEKSKAKKGSAAKKTDDLESYVYRNEKGELSIPGEYLRMSIIGAAKFRQDPRSPRKSAMDLFKAGVVSVTNLASFGVTKWDYEDRRRVTIQRAAITRTRPAIKAGYSLTIQLMVNLPEYISPALLNEVIQQAGKLIGIGDFRPTFGRFQVVQFEIVDL